MDKVIIDEIYQKLIDGYWGDIDPNWFKFIDLNDPNIEDEYEEHHIAFQKLLQSK